MFLCSVVKILCLYKSEKMSVHRKSHFDHIKYYHLNVSKLHRNSVILHELLLIAKQCAEYNLYSHLNVMIKKDPCFYNVIYFAKVFLNVEFRSCCKFHDNCMMIKFSWLVYIQHHYIIMYFDGIFCNIFICLLYIQSITCFSTQI